MSVLENIFSHFDSKGVQTIEVPEWGPNENEPLIIHFTPININEQSKLKKTAIKSGEVIAMVDCLIMKAMDKDLNPLFSVQDKPKLLRKADPDIIAQLAAKIIGIDRNNEDEVEEK